VRQSVQITKENSQFLSTFDYFGPHSKVFGSLQKKFGIHFLKEISQILLFQYFPAAFQFHISKIIP
jgi:hypothetical protein